MNNKIFRDAISKQCGFTPNKAKPTAAWIETPTACYLVGKPYKSVQVCNAGDWPEDHGGNWTPDRREANHAFSDWLDSHSDALPLPESFSEWCEQNNDSIIQ